MSNPLDRHPYSLDDITPERMALVDKAMEISAVENEIFNGKNLVHTYGCERCHWVTITVDRQVGTTPYMIGCTASEAGCAGTATSNGYTPKMLVRNFEGRIDREWYRPLTEEECHEFVETVRRSADDAVEKFAELYGGYPEGDDQLRRAVQEQAVSFILMGGLVLREFRSDPVPVEAGPRESASERLEPGE